MTTNDSSKPINPEDRPASFTKEDAEALINNVPTLTKQEWKDILLIIARSFDYETGAEFYGPSADAANRFHKTYFPRCYFNNSMSHAISDKYNYEDGDMTEDRLAEVQIED